MVQSVANRRVTMVEVARAAGVSQSTVSVIVNKRPDVAVADETRERVLRVASELGFQPNRAAQSLKLNESFLVGIVTTGIVSGPYAGRIVAGIQKTVEATGKLCLLADATENPVEGDAAVAGLLAQGVTGIIYASYMPIAVHTSPLLAQVETLFVNCWPSEPGVGRAVILADEYRGGYAAAKAAFAAGHVDVAFLGGTRGEYACVERHRGFVDAAAAAGLDPDRLAQAFGNYEISSGHDLTIEAFAHRHPTALVCGNDRMAAGAVLALHTLGLEVPGDVSVIGFDDQPDLADQFRPPLTTVALPHYDMGRRAAELLTQSDDQAEGRILIPCPLVTRESLARPRDATGTE